MKRTTELIPIALLFVGVTVGAIVLSLAVNGPSKTPVRATILPEARPLPNFSLVDQNAMTFSQEDLTGRWHVLFFGFAHCPDICPATLQQLAIARNRVVGDGHEFPGIVLVSVDPERDTPATLATYVRNFGQDVTGLTGTPESLLELTKPLGIYFAKSGDPDGDYTVDHSSVVLLIDDDANWRAVFSAPHDVDSFAGDIRLLMDAG